MHKYLLAAAERAAESPLQNWQIFPMFSKNKDKLHFIKFDGSMCGRTSFIHVRKWEHPFFRKLLLYRISKLEFRVLAFIFFLSRTQTYKKPHQIGQSQPQNQSTGVKKKIVELSDIDCSQQPNGSILYFLWSIYLLKFCQDMQFKFVLWHLFSPIFVLLWLCFQIHIRFYALYWVSKGGFWRILSLHQGIVINFVAYSIQNPRWKPSELY